MKTQNNRIKILGFLSILCLTLFSFKTVNVEKQHLETIKKERTIKGNISDSNGPLLGAEVTLKGTKTGVSTDGDGNFTFPKTLNTGDVLVITYLGFKTVNFKIKEDTSFIKVTMTEEVVEIIGALSAEKPYKSKRKN